jgi:CRP-like cAMP-binding protein
MNKILATCSLFKGVSPEKIAEIFDNIFFKVKKYDISEIIAYQDDEVEHLMIVLDGTARGEMVDFSGKTVIIEEIESPRPLAPGFIFGMKNKFPVNIVSQTKTTVIKIQKSEFVKMLQLNDKLLVNFMNNVSGRAQFLTQKIKFLSFNSIKGKMAFYILNLSKNTNSNYVTLPVSQSKLSDLFGVARPSLARAIREMHNDGVVKAEAKNIRILDKTRLLEYME